MSIKDATVERFKNICKQRHITFNELANLSGVTPSTVYSMIDPRRRDVSLLTVKKLTDGLDMELKDFFNSVEFRNLDQEIF
ncbi:MAG: helix-turn-helix transcriptional regulator [Anaerofustis stercorihominis]|nr:helix-turn-helix transcriptional regulator [Anaerofustis stercorihominis]